jgi:hypothetical protein
VSGNMEMDALFMGLVLNIHGSALQYLGKIASPIDGKVERNIEAAKQTIDLLAALEHKTRGNLSDDESKALREMLTHLQLNFVEESKKGSTEPEDDVEAAVPPADSAADEGDDNRESGD